MRYLLISLLVMLSLPQVACGGDVVVTVRSFELAALERNDSDLVQEIATQGYFEATNIELFFILEVMLKERRIVVPPRIRVEIGGKTQLGFFGEDGQPTGWWELGIQEADEENIVVSFDRRLYRIASGGGCLVYDPKISEDRVMVIQPQLRQPAGAVD